MSDTPSPFSDYASRKQRAPGSGRNATAAWAVAGLLGVAAVVLALMWATELGDARGLKRQLAIAQNKLTTVETKLHEANGQLDTMQGQIGELEREKENVGQSAKSLEDEMRNDLESKDVTISKLQGKLTVNILDRVLFDSGEATLKTEGQSVLLKVASILAQHPEIKIHVIGHTDNVPMHGPRFASNWELSAARAMAAVHFFVERAGVDPRRVGAVGYGEFRPIADNATAEGRAKNRRIAITILSDELAGVDTTTNIAAAVAQPAATNAPAPIPLPQPAAH